MARYWKSCWPAGIIETVGDTDGGQPDPPVGPKGLLHTPWLSKGCYTPAWSNVNRGAEREKEKETERKTERFTVAWCVLKQRHWPGFSGDSSFSRSGVRGR